MTQFPKLGRYHSDPLRAMLIYVGDPLVDGSAKSYPIDVCPKFTSKVVALDF